MIENEAGVTPAVLDAMARTPDARLRSYHPEADEPFADLTGHAQLASIPNTMRGMYRATTHMMTITTTVRLRAGAGGCMQPTTRTLALCTCCLPSPC